MTAESPSFDHDDPVAYFARIFKALSDPSRLRILGLVAARPYTGKELSEALEITPPTLSHHLEKLTSTGLVTVDRNGQSRYYALDLSVLAKLNALISGERPALDQPTEQDDVTKQRQSVLKNFFEGDRLTQIPASRKKRVIVLQYLLERFDPAKRYTEREVNDLLRLSNPDVASLRRELVDYGFLKRENGIYWVAREPPQRSTQVAQEITGDEYTWLRQLLNRSFT